MIGKIKKREGYREKFKAEKIVAAIIKAMNEVDEIDGNVANQIAEKIAKQDKDFMHIEDIQDLIEQYLIEAGKVKTVKAFILYRKARAEKRAKGWGLDELQQAIMDKKYMEKNETFDEWLDRVSGGNKKLRKLIKDKKFLFAGRILAHRGLDKNVTYSNCYVQKKPSDNIESIFDTAKELARTYSYGGGCGVDISNLRPRGAVVNNSARETTGAVSFMQLYDLTTSLIGQNGRRGALMISIADTHPDLPEFINIKTQSDMITKANISIRVTKAFMQAVENDEDWTLSFTTEKGDKIEKTMKARELYRMNCQNNWDWAEAGFLFWDTITQWHLMSEHPEHEYEGVNPCAEEPLMAGGSCLLGSLNLSEFVCHPFTPKAKFDYNKFRDAVRTAVVGLNEVLDEGLERHPLQIQRDNARDWRQIGLGIMGIADMLIKLGIKYGGGEALYLCNLIAHELINEAVYSSAMLAKEHGAFPKYDEAALFASEFFKANIKDEYKEVVKQYGLYNSQLLTIAPTGTLSTMWGISGGIEPIFAISYIRTTQSLHGEDVDYEVFTPIIKELMAALNIKNKKDLPDYVITAHDLQWRDRLMMQGVFQWRIDASISSTVNLPTETTVEEVEELFMTAAKLNLKGVTIFRDGCKRVGILNVSDADKEQDVEDNAYTNDTKFQTCPECGEQIEIIQNGCTICKCGYSPCH